MPAPGVGDRAPDFTLDGTGGRTFTLSDYRGAPVLLVFYPGDDTPVCRLQLRSYSEDMGSFSGLGAAILAISPQDVASHERFACREHLAMPLLADTGKDVARAYGVLGPLGFYRRSVFVIDPEGTIRYAHRGLSGLTYRTTEDLLPAVRDAASTVR